ncbi:MAG: alpha/beta fold hydrolase [Acidimicrobiia bacterium]
MIIETDAGSVSLEQIGAGPDIVLLHSLLSDRNVFAPIVPALASTHRVSLVDLPGFGSTSLIEADMNAYGDMIGALLRAGSYDPDTTCVLGNGLGGFVALATAIRHGSAFDKLVVAGCGAGFTEAGRGAFRGMVAGVQQGGMEAIIEVAIRRIFAEDYLAAHPDQAEERRAVLRRSDPAAFVAACTALLGLDYFEASKGVTNPTLVIAGSHDQATPPAMAIDLADRVPGARLEIMDGVAHAPQLQDPDGFLTLLQGFLD